MWCAAEYFKQLAEYGIIVDLMWLDSPTIACSTGVEKDLLELNASSWCP